MSSHETYIYMIYDMTYKCKHATRFEIQLNCSCLDISFFSIPIIFGIIYFHIMHVRETRVFHTIP